MCGGARAHVHTHTLFPEKTTARRATRIAEGTRMSKVIKHFLGIFWMFGFWTQKTI